MSSKRAIRRKACKRKVRHATAQAGQEAVHRLHKTKGYQGQLDVYGCCWCGGFHVGHSKRSSQGRI